MDRNERAVSPRAIIVDSASNQFFTGAALSQDENRRAGTRHLFDKAVDLLYLVIFSDKLVEAGPAF